MKKNVFIITALLFILFSCQKSNKQSTKTTSKPAQTQVTTTTTDTSTTIPKYNGEKNQVTVSDYDYTAPYICPNHCPGSGSNKPGKCPVCGMDLIPNPDYQKPDSTQ